MKKIFIWLLLVIQILQATNQFELLLPSGTHKNVDLGTVYRFAMDSNRNMYVTDSFDDRIIKLNSNGKRVKSWGGYGVGNGKFSDIGGVTVDSTRGYIYITDEKLHRVQKFDLDGTFIASWGTEGSSSGKFDTPKDVAVDSHGNVFIVDTNNNRIQKFTNSGMYILQWGVEGNQTSQFDKPVAIAIDSEDKIYVADRNNNRIQKFDTSGNFILMWGSSGLENNNGMFNNLASITVGPQNKIYVSDYYDIQIFDSNGNYIDTLVSIHDNYMSTSSAGFFRWVNGLAVDVFGNIYIADSSNSRIHKFDKHKNHIASWGRYGSGIGEFYQPTDMAIDKEGNKYVVDSENHRIQKFTKNGIFITKWGKYGQGDGEFMLPTGIAINSDGDVYIADEKNHRIQKFTSSGVYLSQWGSYGTYEYEFKNPKNIAIDSHDNIYVVDKYNKRIQKYNKSGNYIKSWYVDYPNAIGINQSTDEIYVASSDYEIIKFNADGEELLKWGTKGTDDGEFENQSDITVDTNGNVFVSDLFSKDVQKFTHNGQWLASYEVGQRMVVTGLASDNLGNIYATVNDGDGKDGIYRLATTPDIDGDGVLNDNDAFPHDPNEWLDTDHDGIGNNADSDDDNDGINDTLEIANGLNPLNASDAQADFDHDGFSNAIEVSVGTNIRDTQSKPIWTPIMMGEIIMFVPAKT